MHNGCLYLQIEALSELDLMEAQSMRHSIAANPSLERAQKTRRAQFKNVGRRLLPFNS